ATGMLLAILEDRGWPRPDWARAMVDLHHENNYSAIGGAIEQGGAGPLRWAVFFCDFGRYQSPVEPGDPEYLSDINICYKREALASVREVWKERYQESLVNWALRRRGHRLHLSGRPVVIQQRGDVAIYPLLKERVHWARIFAQARGGEMSVSGCLLWASAT